MHPSQIPPRGRGGPLAVVGVTPLPFFERTPPLGENLGFVVMTSGAIRFYVYTPKRAVGGADKKYLIYFL